jgi:hypothetical protein
MTQWISTAPAFVVQSDLGNDGGTGRAVGQALGHALSVDGQIR